MSNRRAFLVTALSVGVAAGVGVVFLMTGSPMPASNKPAPFLDIALGELRAGAPRLFTLNDAPFALVRTTNAMLDDLQAQTIHTWSQRPIPAERPAFFVYALVSAVPGCVARHAPEGAPRYAPERVWQRRVLQPVPLRGMGLCGASHQAIPGSGRIDAGA